MLRIKLGELIGSTSVTIRRKSHNFLEVIMFYTKETIAFLVKTTLFFAALSLSTQLYAKNKAVFLDRNSINKVVCIDTNCFFPKKVPTNNDIYVNEQIDWNRDDNLVLLTKGNIIFGKNGKVTSTKNGSIILKAGMMPGEKEVYDSTVRFEGDIFQVENLGDGIIKIYYNPIKGKNGHKYLNPIVYSNKLPGTKLETYMLVNDIYDLQGITSCLYGNYALSQDIDASPTKEWNDGKGFFPIKEWNAENPTPFSGIFDGNNHVIKYIYINRPLESNVGIFGDVTGVNEYHSVLKNFTIKNAFIRGRYCVGAAVGQATRVKIFNVYSTGSDIDGKEKPGEVFGCIFENTHRAISADNNDVYENGTLKGRNETKLFGVCVRCKKIEDDDKINFGNKDDN